MRTSERQALEESVSIVSGVPLDSEPRIGALNLPRYLREVTTWLATREAFVMNKTERTVERWRYSELRARTMMVARALTVCGVGKDTRVRVLISCPTRIRSADPSHRLATRVSPTPL